MMESASNGIGGAWRSAFPSPSGRGCCAAAGEGSVSRVADSALEVCAVFRPTPPAPLPEGEGSFSAGAGCDFAGSSGFAAAPPSSASIVAITLPSETSSPTLTFISLTVPANGAGTSMVALLDHHLDHRHPVEITDVGYLRLAHVCHVASFDSGKAARRPVSRIWPLSSCTEQPDPKVTVTSGGWQTVFSSADWPQYPQPWSQRC